jgi:hypothetical protein
MNEIFVYNGKTCWLVFIEKAGWDLLRKQAFFIRLLLLDIGWVPSLQIISSNPMIKIKGAH